MVTSAVRGRNTRPNAVSPYDKRQRHPGRSLDVKMVEEKMRGRPKKEDRIDETDILDQRRK
ncbi:hypothetical protein HETIRDRAFT_305556 [Heterobasidion irregulare TC 32-1]|uniref:Uncharacterized protein n=1 Tax=Heterobasidion irregulare (strain TC 32-1) TaxID=747525 RepID=W4KS03_HETIT|nr:uncharacterized protein HETIRDRAFT_305556 [Heterobasidion irregulare TC 32-1]ETW87836.1 hypothetical protein HETIRDRAFT_305556 [Heterobasidion irregulare TC 32-1]